MTGCRNMPFFRCSMYICMIWLMGLACALPARAEYRQYSNLPTLYVETFNGKGITSKTDYVFCRLVMVDGLDTIYYDSVQIRGRGNSTWNMEKKPYRLKFKTSTRFLGRGYAKARNWILLANYADKSLIRNALASEMGTFMGQPYTAAAKFVDLVMNGTFMGNYQISDHISIDKKRIDIVEQKKLAGEYSNITGGYFLEIGAFSSSEPKHFTTTKGVVLSIKSPEEEIINQKQQDYIRQCIQNFEDRLYSTDYRQSLQGYRTLTDSATLISWYLACELSANYDGLWSTYIYKNQDDPLIYWGPLWDFDIAFNNCHLMGDVTQEFMTDKALGGSNAARKWVERMITDPWFNYAVNESWKRMVNADMEGYLHTAIDSLASLNAQSQNLNYQRWNTLNTKVYREIYLYNTYDEYIEQLKRFITEHMQFLSQGFAARAGDAVPLFDFKCQEGYSYRITNIGTGNAVDLGVDSTKVVTQHVNGVRKSQEWELRSIDGHYQIVNCATGMAFHDPSSLTVAGSQLDVVKANVTDSRQLWDIVTVNNKGIYNLINVGTGYAVNNNDGSSVDDNPLTSYISDSRNSVSLNRKWSLTPVEFIPDYVDADVLKKYGSICSRVHWFLSEMTEDIVGSECGDYPQVEVVKLQQLIDEADSAIYTSTEEYIEMTACLSDQFDKATCPIFCSEEETNLVKLLNEVEEKLNNVDEDWFSDYPFGHSLEVKERCSAIRNAYGQGWMDDNTIDEYTRELQILRNKVDILNIPNPDDCFFLVNTSGHYLNCHDGVILADTAMCSEPSVYRFLPLNGLPNAYYIATEGGYLGMMTGGNGIPTITAAKRSSYGKFVVEQTGPRTFTLSTIYGLLGANGPISDGTPCVGNAEEHTTWTLILAPEGYGDDGIEQLSAFDYAVKYDMDAGTISFESEDLDGLAAIKADIYTTGGYHLYSFCGDREQSLSDLPSGTYLLRWSVNGKTKAVKFYLKNP